MRDIVPRVGETAETDMLVAAVRERRTGGELEELLLEVSDEADPIVVLWLHYVAYCSWIRRSGAESQ